MGRPSSIDRDIDSYLPATLENAARAPHYARAWGRRWRGIRTLGDLARLPLLDKLTAIEHQEDLVVGEAPPGFGVVSSGTTRRELDLRPLNVLHSDAEDEAIARAARELPPLPEDPHPGWTLVSVSVTHGLPGGPPAAGEIHLPWLYDRNALYMLEGVLSRPHGDGRRITAMRISVGALKAFTAWLLERGRDPAALGVRLIGTNSFRLSPFWRTRIEAAYAAQIFDNYSLSEIVTPATECAACGWHHFGFPPLAFEVLDLLTGASLRHGAGRLVLTGLYPFVQKMPLVRYDTGDVIERGPRCPATGAASVRFLGRVRRGLVVDDDGRGVYVLAPTVIQDVLEELPESERTPHPLVTLGLLRTRDIGLPRWEVRGDGDDPRSLAAVALAFEVRFDPHVYRAHAAHLETGVRAEVLRLDPRLRRLVRKKRLRFTVSAVSPGTLRPPPDKYD